MPEIFNPKDLLFAKKNIVLAFVLCVFTLALAVTKPPVVLRACLDRVTGTVTVYFYSPSDACNSFKFYELWGRDDVSNPFSKLSTLSTLASTQIQASLPNKKKWELFVKTMYACNNKDTLFSDTVFIDDTPPAYIEPDSVSVDFASQQLIAGWTKAPEPDVMGYSIFKVDPVTGNNLLIDEKDVLGYLFKTTTFDPKNGGIKLSIAAYDSCRNGGIISNFHSPVLLGFNNGQNKNYLCTRKLFIDWSAYVGWPVASYDILVWDSKSGLWKLDGSVSGSTFTYVYNIPSLGTNYSFIVRAHKNGSSISSSSNRIDISLQDFAKPSLNSLGHVSVIADGSIEITGLWEFTSSLSKAILQTKTTGSMTWVNLATYLPNAGPFKFVDLGKQTSSKKYDYRIMLYNTCGATFDSSAVHTSIVLKRSFYNVSWNEYWAWALSNHKTDLASRNKQGSTWNNENISPDSSTIFIDTIKPFCYKVLALIYGLNNKTVDSAWSNEICLKAFDSTLVPGAFSPGGINPVFKIINLNLLHGEANMLIYNRWGQKLFDGDALDGWDGKDAKGEFVGPGFYPYIINIKTPEKRSSYKGTVMVLR